MLERNEVVSSSCKQMMSGTGESDAMARAILIIAPRVLAMPRVA